MSIFGVSKIGAEESVDGDGAETITILVSFKNKNEPPAMETKTRAPIKYFTKLFKEFLFR